MKADGHTHSSLHNVSRRQIRATIVRDLLNTTWRMLVPTLVGIALGMATDQLLHSSPAGFLTGACLGFGVGIWLALRLLHKAEEWDV